MSERPLDRRRIDEVFGDTVPDTTSDERDDRERQATDRSDEWLRENRPPHW